MIIIGGIEIARQAGRQIRQTLNDVGGRTVRRTENGQQIVLKRWTALNSTISGTGWLPDGLDGLDLDIAHDVYCIHPLSVASTNNVITIPRTPRTDADYAPRGAAIVNHHPIGTPIALVGNVATLTPVPDASQYHVVYYPIINGILSISRNYDARAAENAWTIEVSGNP